MRCSIYVPAYEVERQLSSVISRIPAEAWDMVVSCWIINDGSKDGTAAVIDRLACDHTKIKPVHFRQNQGYGKVVKQGLINCLDDEVDYAVCLHGDGQYPPEAIPSFLRVMEDHQIDILQGSRHAQGTALRGGMPLYKWAAGHCLTRLENVVFGLKMTDYHSGFLMYSRTALQRLPFAHLSRSFDIDLELIACGRAAGLKIEERPIPTHYGDEISHLQPVVYGFRVLGVVARFLCGRYHRRLQQHHTPRGGS